MAGTGIFVDCPGCKKNVEIQEPKTPPGRFEEMNLWENASSQCPECEKIGIITFHQLNMNLPESEFDPLEIDSEPYFPEGEYEKRQKIRALMWKVRPDLKTKSRPQVDQAAKAATEKRYGKSVEAIRNERANERANQRGNEA